MMRLRKFELVFVGITLAFLIFMGGFFTGRSFNRVNIDGFDTFRVETSVNSDEITMSAQLQPYDTGSPTSTDNVNSADSGTDTGSHGTITEYATENATTNPDESTNQGNAAQAEPVPGAPRGGDGRININTASKNELMDLPGIGPSLADSIVEYRNANGAFASIEEIMNVSGIAEGRFARIRDRITV